jgi:uncharacterized repeat protein (TIGR01451 family)
LPRIDPSGERLLTWTPTPITAVPGGAVPAIAAPGLTLTPARIIAPVGSEVLMVAGVHGPGNPNLVGQRVEWLLDQSSVGQFLAVGQSETPRILRFDTPPQKVSNQYAVSETQSSPRIITRGTIDPADDVSILPGQAWVTVTSPIEGTSYVTAFAPDIQGVQSNRQSGTIHWVDVRWTAPNSATAPVGSKHSVVTTVMRATTGAPLAGYKVRYELAGGTTAGFGPALSGGVELTTNEQGIATAELASSDASGGVSHLNVQLVRPAGIVPGSQEALVLGSTSVAVTWAPPASAQPALPGAAIGGSTPPAEMAPPVVSPPLGGQQQTPPSAQAANIQVRVSSPAEAVRVGAQAAFEIQLFNRSGRALQNVTIRDVFAAGLRHATRATSIERTEKEIPPGETKIELNFTVTQPGQHCHTVDVSIGGQRVATAQGCVTAIAANGQAGEATFTIKKTGPQRLQVGEIGLYKVEVTNLGTQPINGLRLKESWAQGLKAIQATVGNETTGANEITWQYDKLLAAGGSVLFEVRYQAVAAAAKSCSQTTIEAGGASKSEELCIEITPAAAGKGS